MSTNFTNENEISISAKRASRRKRGLDPESNELNLTPATKKQKPYKMSKEELSEIKHFIASMQKDIENKIDSSQSSIETKINNFTTTVNNEIQQLKCSVDEMNIQMGADINALKVHVTEHTQRLNNNEDDINRLKLSADLRINGIPYNQNENLVELFHKIASSINYDCTENSHVPLLKRIPVRDKISGSMVQSSIIALHFTSCHHKNQFYSLYLSKMPLKAESIGLPKEQKIIIGESLTRTNAQIFKFAQSLKKDNKIAQTFTVDGLVKVKFIKGPNQRAHTIRNTMQLELLLNTHEQQMAQQQNQHQTSAPTNPMDTDTTNTQQLNNSSINSSIELITNGQCTNIESQPNGQQQQLHQQHQFHQNNHSAVIIELQSNGQQQHIAQQLQQIQQQKQHAYPTHNKTRR